jgi:hypothetical protein
VGLPCTVMSCGDVIYRNTLPQNDGLTITVPGVALALAAVSYLWSPPASRRGSSTCSSSPSQSGSSDQPSARCTHAHASIILNPECLSFSISADLVDWGLRSWEEARGGRVRRRVQGVTEKVKTSIL